MRPSQCPVAWLLVVGVSALRPAVARVDRGMISGTVTDLLKVYR
jgi:hypothetical protein